MKLDKDDSGTIERDEFLSLPQVSSNPLATRMIAIFDEDGGGSVDFQEFVSGLSAFSSRGSKEEKLRFAFKVYDIDRDGYISNGELFVVLKMMVGSNLKDGQLQQIVDKTIMEADLDGDGKISFEEFEKMVENTDVSNSMTLGELFDYLCGGSCVSPTQLCCAMRQGPWVVSANSFLQIRSEYGIWLVHDPACEHTANGVKGGPVCEVAATNSTNLEAHQTFYGA